MSVLRRQHFAYDCSLEPTPEYKWHQNVTVEILCDTIERGIELLREIHPDATIHAVRKLGAGRAIIVDDEPTKVAPKLGASEKRRRRRLDRENQPSPDVAP